jgi:hypothetical protein
MPNTHLAGCTPSAFAFADPAEVAFIAFEHRKFGFDLGHLGGDALAQLVEEQRCGVAMHAGQIGGGSSCHFGDEQLQQLGLLFSTDPTTM